MSDIDALYAAAFVRLAERQGYEVDALLHMVMASDEACEFDTGCGCCSNLSCRHVSYSERADGSWGYRLT